MNKSIAFLLIFVFLTASSIIIIQPVWASADSWVSKAPMHVARGSLGVAVVDGKIYAIGGSTQVLSADALTPYPTSGAVGTNEQYDPATDTWTTKAPMPTPRYDFSITVYQGKIYCIGGGGAGEYGTTGVNEAYNPATDTWETKAPLPVATRMAHSSVVVDGKIYLIDSNVGTYVYDPLLDSWSAKTPMPIRENENTGTPIVGFTSTAVDGKIYVLGGVDTYNWVAAPIQIYDPQTDTWSYSPSSLFVDFGSAAHGPSPVYGAVTVATTGAFAPKQIYLMGKLDAASPGQPLFPNAAYDPVTGGWTIAASIQTNRVNFGLANVNDALYAIGGSAYNGTKYNGQVYFATGPVTPSSANEQYTPIRYVAPTPSPSPSPTPTQSPTQTPTPSPKIPEFPSLIIPSFAVIATLLVVIAVGIKRKNRSKDK